MFALCQFILLATIFGIVVSDSDIHMVDVTCDHTYGDQEICRIPKINYRRNTPSHLNILNYDTSYDTTIFRMIEGHYSVMPLNLFQLFPKLTKLDISTGLKAITKESLIGGSKLKILALSDNKIRAVTAHTFDGMDKLEFIVLEGNKLTNVEPNAFAGAISLKNLDLRLNEIDTIEDGAFSIPTLEEINLSHNKLQTLGDDVFVGCPNLKTVSLYGNVLTRIGKSIDNSPKFNYLSFGNKNVTITDFDFYAIARYPHLKTFIADGVALVLDDPASAANDNYTATYLDISQNNLSYPDILHRLRNFHNLIKLVIGKNNFTTINDIQHILEMFPKLEELDIGQIPCKDEVIASLQTKFGDKITLKHSTIVVFSDSDSEL